MHSIDDVINFVPFRGVSINDVNFWTIQIWYLSPKQVSKRQKKLTSQENLVTYTLLYMAAKMAVYEYYTHTRLTALFPGLPG